MMAFSGLIRKDIRELASSLCTHTRQGPVSIRREGGWLSAGQKDSASQNPTMLAP